MGDGRGKHGGRIVAGLLAPMLLATAVPAGAQFSESFNFLKAVRDRDGTKASAAVDKPGSQIINTKDYNTGEGALHILVKRRDTTWLNYLLSKGASPDIRDREGNTPLMLATQLGYVEGVQTLVAARAGINMANGSGETPIIRAVQNRDLELVRLLLTEGADPRLTDRIAGKSARDYAAEDSRSAAILKAIEAAPAPKAKRAVAGPVLR